MTSELLVRPALELAELLRRGEVSAPELVEAALRRAEDLGPVVNAFVLLDADGAIRAAEQVHAGRGSGTVDRKRAQ